MGFLRFSCYDQHGNLPWYSIQHEVFSARSIHVVASHKDQLTEKIVINYRKVTFFLIEYDYWFSLTQKPQQKMIIQRFQDFFSSSLCVQFSSCLYLCLCNMLDSTSLSFLCLRFCLRLFCQWESGFVDTSNRTSALNQIDKPLIAELQLIQNHLSPRFKIVQCYSKKRRHHSVKKTSPKIIYQHQAPTQ